MSTMKIKAPDDHWLWVENSFVIIWVRPGSLSYIPRSLEICKKHVSATTEIRLWKRKLQRASGEGSSLESNEFEIRDRFCLCKLFEIVDWKGFLEVQSWSGIGQVCCEIWKPALLCWSPTMWISEKDKGLKLENKAGTLARPLSRMWLPCLGVLPAKVRLKCPGFSGQVVHRQWDDCSPRTALIFQGYSCLEYITLYPVPSSHHYEDIASHRP